MKFNAENARRESGSIRAAESWRPGEAAYTLTEVLIVVLLIGILTIAGFGAALSMDACSRRAGDYIAATAVVEAKVRTIQASTYNPPNANFGSSTIYLTNSDSIALNQAGTTFLVPGTLISKIEPVASGHLVTVTGTFQEPRRTLTVTLQTVVNRFSAGQQ